MMTECDEKCWNGSWNDKKKKYISGKTGEI